MKKLTELPVKLLALSEMNGPSDEAYRYIEIYNQHKGDKVRLLFPSSILANISPLKSYLLAKGYTPLIDQQQWKQVQEILSSDCNERVYLSKRPGFVKNTYLAANGRVFGKKDKYGPLFHPEIERYLPMEKESGDLDIWKNKVALLALCSSRLMLAICSSFSGFLLKTTGLESGGFHFYGRSSIGKSSCLYLASSVFGSPQFIEKWKATEKGFEEMAEAHNDSVLMLDELKSVHEDPKMAAQIAQNRIYTLTDGKGKQRSKSYQSNPSKWRLILLSTGEESLNQHADNGGLERMAGEQVRVIDVPADAGKGLGIYEHIPDDIKSAEKIAKDIEYQCHKYYGEAKVAFLQGVINSLENNPEKFKRLLSKWINYFLRKNSVNENIGIEVRTAKRFALAYAAGVLAIEYKVLPFTREDVMKGVSKCLHDSIQSQQKQNKKIDYWSKILKILRAEGCLDLSDTQKHYSKDEIESAKVVSCAVNKIPVLALKSACFDELVPDFKVRQNLLKKLAIDGVLIQDSEGKNKRQIPYKGRNLARRYCFVGHNVK